MTKMTIGYLIPEFPGQTHNFFWRERQALQEMGIATRLVSTRRPPKGIVSASWARQAETETTYLYPFSLPDFFKAVKLIMAAGPRAWYRCAKLIIGASGMSPWQRLRLTVLVPFAAKLARIGELQGWSHVHVHSCADAANIALLASRLSACTYSLTLHGRLSTYGANQAEKWSHAAFAIVVTHRLHEEAVSFLGAHLPEHLEIAPMGVNVDTFGRRSPYIPQEGAGELAIFCCGRLNQGKGYAYLVDAVGMLRQQGVGVRVEIAGEDEQGGAGYRKVLERQILESGLGDIITLLGAVPEERVRECLEKAHVFVLASLDEAVGVVLMEAMAMGVPVVATDVGGVSELVDANVDGILVPPGDPGVIAGAVMKLAQDPELAGRLSNSSRQKIIRLFNHRRSAQAIARLLTRTAVSCRKIGEDRV